MKNKLLTLFIGVLFNTAMGVMLFHAVGFAPQLGAALFVAVGFVAGYLGRHQTERTTALHAGLFMETWIKAVKDNLFYGSTLFMTRMMDYSAQVNFNTLNFAELGTTPEVYVNASGAISTVDNVDTNYTVELKIYDTQNTAITNARAVERSYDQVAAYTAKHRNVLSERMAKDAIFEYAPITNTVGTPLFATTGDAAGPNNHKKMKIADIIALQRAFNVANFPADGRVLVLHPDHISDICEEDTTLYKAFTDINSGTVPTRLYGFEVYMSTLTPRYDASLATKVPTTATPPPSASVSSVAFLVSESCKAEGIFVPLYRPFHQDPENRKETIGFQARFVAKPVRSIGYAALVSLA